MQTRVRVLGHPLHVILIVFPLGLLPISFLFDILYLVTDNPRFSIAGYWMLAAGIVGAVAAAGLGVADWTVIPARTRAKRVGLLHGVINAVALVIFVLSWVLRLPLPEQPEFVSVILSGLGVVLASIAGWLGGELVYRMNIGVDDGAHPNSPRSLSGRPATDSEAP
jgi:uncharacterized membrane protein